MKKLSIALLTCVLAYASPGFAQNLITNGSFEKPRVPSGSFTIFTVTPPPAIPGWTVVGPGSNVFIGSTTLCDPTVCYPAQDLKQFLDLTGAGSNAIEGVEQPVPTTIGEFYQLSYWVGNVSIGGVFGTSSTVTVNINGTPLTSDTNSMSSPVSGGVSLHVWQQFIHVFQATSSVTTITFLNGDPSTDGINGLDNVVLLHLCCPR